MACPNKNRHRPKTVAFRVTEEENLRIEQRVKITGEVKGDYLRAMALYGEIDISVGKYKSDRLALALRKLTEVLQVAMNSEDDMDFRLSILETRILAEELYRVAIGEYEMDLVL